MATEAHNGESASSPQLEPDETSITSSMARLQEMHVALRNLRDTIPRVMESVLVDPFVPEQLNSRFSQAATGAASDIKSFTQIMEDGHSKEALEKAKVSRARSGEDITGWLVTNHKEWLDPKQDRTIEDLDIERTDLDAKIFAGDSTIEALQTTLENFKESNRGIEASLDETSKIIEVYLPPPAHIHFRVQLDMEGRGNYEIHSKEKTKLHDAILAAIAARPRPDGLDSLLQMFASYFDIKSRPCAKCSCLYDRNAQLPVGRSKKRAKQATGQYMDQWEAFHTACI